MNGSDRSINQGYSVLCPSGPYQGSNRLGSATLADPTQLALGLLYVAAVHNNAEAQLILSYRYAPNSHISTLYHNVLGHRYQYGLAVVEDLETACQYSLLAAAAASEDYHKGKT